MKHLLALLLVCLLLTGCGSRVPSQPVPPTEVPETLPPAKPVSLIFTEVNGVRTYALPMEAPRGLRTMGDKLILFSGEDTLTLLGGEHLAMEASVRLDFPLSADDPSLTLGSAGLSYFDSNARETVVLDASLREVSRIAAPQDMVGAPILSEDGNTLFYCTANAIRAWDLNSGIRRMVKEGADQVLTGLRMDGTVLQCPTSLISARDGRLLWEGEEGFTLADCEGRWYADLPVGMRRSLIFDGGVLNTRYLAEGQFLPALHGAVTVEPGVGQQKILSYYDLESGLRSSELTLDAETVYQVEAMGGYVYILSDDTLRRWDVSALPSGDTEVYLASDISLEACRLYADSIADRYGIQVLIGQEAAAAQPWDYSFTPETDGSALWQQLETLDKCLSHFPQTLLKDTAAPFSSLSICLVQKIQGTPESGSVETANGVQYLNELHNCIALAVGPRFERTLYHELFHVMETRLLVESTAFDQWENLNPKSFRYDMRYGKAHDDEFLQGEGRAFIDAYSMSYPKEDRARVMEYAMTPGNASIFEHEILQAKLEALCTGIRQAYGLRKSPETYLWEQYLKEPMAYQG